ncbi:hypothetical protein AB0C40_24490 [Streptomyces brevispora]|uniref:hypothetical protein n=1 Tax=Streptomyces brevispora TaxID=887462 RepID=UPI0034037132
MTTPGTKWGTFQSLKGCLVNDPAVTALSDDRLIVFAEGGNNGLWHIWQNRDLSWSPWEQLPGARVKGIPAAVLGRDGLIRVFWRSPEDELFVSQTKSVHGGGFTSPFKLTTGAVDNPAAVLNADGRISVFYRGSDQAARHVDHQSVAYTTWASSKTLDGGIKGIPYPILAADGRVEVFVRGTDDNLWVSQQKAPDSTSDWSGFAKIVEGLTSDPRAALDADGRIRVVFRGRDNAGYFVSQKADYDTWNVVGSLGGELSGGAYPFRSPLDGRLEVFVTGTDKSTWAAEQKSVNTETFETFVSLGGGIADGSIPARHTDGRIFVFVRGTDNAIWYAQQFWA